MQIEINKTLEGFSALKQQAEHILQNLHSIQPEQAAYYK
jgi:hypothetical protein